MSDDVSGEKGLTDEQLLRYNRQILLHDFDIAGQERLLRVEAPHFVAGAVWRRGAEGWSCVAAAPIIAWMRGKAALDVGDYLKTKGWSYTWTCSGNQRSEPGL